MTALRDLIAEHRLHQTFWVLNPNSGDTDGHLLDGWRTWDETKYALLKGALWQHKPGRPILRPVNAVADQHHPTKIGLVDRGRWTGYRRFESPNFVRYAEHMRWLSTSARGGPDAH